MNLILDEHSESIVRRHVESGRYPSPAQVVSEALKLLESLESADLEELRREIARGIEQADRGELIDGEEVFRELRRRYPS